MFGREVELKSLGQPSFFFWLKSFVERSRRMGVEIIEDNYDLFSIRIQLIRNQLHNLGPFDPFPLVFHFHVVLAF